MGLCWGPMYGCSKCGGFVPALLRFPEHPYIWDHSCLAACNRLDFTCDSTAFTPFASRLRHFAVSIDKITGIRLANGVNAVLSQVKIGRAHV